MPEPFNEVEVGAMAWLVLPGESIESAAVN
jgi:hypothetical protein